MRYLVSGLLILSLFLTSCSGSKKTQVTGPASARVLPALPYSQINLPVRVYLRDLLAVMDTATSREFNSDHWPEYTQSSCDFRYKYRFLRSAFTFSCVNNKIQIGFQGRYQIAGSKRICAMGQSVSPWVGGSCGFGNEPLRRVDLVIGSKLELLPNHAVRTTTRLESSRPVDKCQVTIMQTDITQQVMDSIQSSIDSYCQTFDHFVQAVNNNPLLQQWRTGGSKVMAVSRYGFLNLNPTQLRVGRFNMVRDSLFFSVGFTGRPLFSSDSASLVTRAPLPTLTNNDYNSGISTYFDATYQYSFFNKLLNDSLRNKPFELEGRTFVIKEVQIGGSNDGKIRVDVSFTGNRKGVLHLSGTPILDTALQVISMPDISFSIDTKDMLVNIAKNLFRKKILKELRNQSVMDIAALIQRNKQLIEARLNQPVTPWLSTTGKLYEIKLLGFLPQDKHIQVQAFVKLDLALIGRPDSGILRGF